MMNRIFFTFLLLVTYLCVSVSAKNIHKEEVYQNKWCSEQSGMSEVLMGDRTRCDCETSEYAIEVDFAKKWAEAIGQSLHYAGLTGKEPGILLIIEKEKDWKYYRRVLSVISYHNLGIKVWTIKPDDI